MGDYIGPVHSRLYHPIIPLVFDDTLSYYEQVCKLYKHFNDLLEYVNTLETELRDDVDTAKKELQDSINKQLGEVKAELQQAVSDLQQQISDFEKRFQELEAQNKQEFEQLKQEQAEQYAQLVQTINQQITALESELDDKFKEIEKKIDDKIVELQNIVFNFKTYTDNQDKYYWGMTQDELQRLEMMIKTNYANAFVYNIIRQKGTWLTDYFRDWYDFSRAWASSAQMWQMAGNTAAFMDAHKWTAVEYDFNNGKPGWLDIYRVFDPVTGEWVSYQKAVQHLADLHKSKAETATDYDDAGLDAEAYDVLALTAYNYDFGGITGIPAVIA